MIDFLFSDPRLLFPNMTESVASTVEFISSLLYLACFVIMIIAEWKLFKKFGEKQWKSLIPGYNSYLMYRYTWKPSAFWIYIVSTVAFNVLHSESTEMTQHSPDSIWVTILLLVALPFGILTAVYSILSALRIAESFGKGKLFCIGLVLLYPIFISILGYGKSKYVGIGGATGDESAAQDEDAADNPESDTEEL